MAKKQATKVHKKEKTAHKRNILFLFIQKKERKEQRKMLMHLKDQHLLLFSTLKKEEQNLLKNNQKQKIKNQLKLCHKNGIN